MAVTVAAPAGAEERSRKERSPEERSAEGARVNLDAKPQRELVWRDALASQLWYVPPAKVVSTAVLTPRGKIPKEPQLKSIIAFIHTACP